MALWSEKMLEPIEGGKLTKGILYLCREGILSSLLGSPKENTTPILCKQPVKLFGLPVKLCYLLESYLDLWFVPFQGWVVVHISPGEGHTAHHMISGSWDDVLLIFFLPLTQWWPKAIWYLSITCSLCNFLHGPCIFYMTWWLAIILSHFSTA